MSEIKERTILQNGMIIPDGRLLISESVHDYVSAEDETNGGYYFTDGGREYIRRGYPTPELGLWKRLFKHIITFENKFTPKDISIYSDTLFEDVRERLHRGSKGKFGKDPFSWTPLKDMSTDWIRSSIKYNRKYFKENSFSSQMYKRELRLRDAKDIADDLLVYNILNSLASE